ncbi:hypothetical protein ACHAWF_014569, partial [Thalassiosira exigua]
MVGYRSGVAGLLSVAAAGVAGAEIESTSLRRPLSEKRNLREQQPQQEKEPQRELYSDSDNEYPTWAPSSPWPTYSPFSAFDSKISGGDGYHTYEKPTTKPVHYPKPTYKPVYKHTPKPTDKPVHKPTPKPSSSYPKPVPSPTPKPTGKPAGTAVWQGAGQVRIGSYSQDAWNLKCLPRSSTPQFKWDSPVSIDWSGPSWSSPSSDCSYSGKKGG